MASFKSENETASDFDTKAIDESGLYKTVRLSVNLLTNIMIILTVFVCMLHSFTSWKLNIFQLHIVMCVLGYQFFMCQGTLVLSKYNSWSMYLSRYNKRRLHWVFQLVGIILACLGSTLMIGEEDTNFVTAHGIFALLAMISSLISLFNGIIAYYGYKVRSLQLGRIKLIHSLSGIGTLLFSCICLCFGFDMSSFRSWAGDDDVIVLMIITCLFTILVCFDFWTNCVKRVFCRQ